jgi:hypothetical protein
MYDVAQYSGDENLIALKKDGSAWTMRCSREASEPWHDGLCLSEPVLRMTGAAYAAAASNGDFLVVDNDGYLWEMGINPQWQAGEDETKWLSDFGVGHVSAISGLTSMALRSAPFGLGELTPSGDIPVAKDEHVSNPIKVLDNVAPCQLGRAVRQTLGVGR